MGFCILLREGVAAWMVHVRSRPQPTHDRIELSLPAPKAGATASRISVDGIDADIVNVLVSMVTAGRVQTRACP